jgi:hypothetical protein
MKQAVAVFVAGCMFLSACGTNGATKGATPPTSLGQSIETLTTNQPANLPTSAQEPTMEASEPTREKPAPTAATAVTSEAQREPAATPGIEGGATTALDPALARLVAGTRADLARRRGVALDAIEVVEARSVTWPDPGLGCPQPGMAYRQVPVDGVLIRLRVDDLIFNYHGGGGRAPFLCEQPAADGSPAPAPGLDK